MIDGFLEVHGDVYQTQLQKRLEHLSSLVNKSTAELVFERIPTMARYLAEWTMPVTNVFKGATGTPDGGGIDAKRLGENRVSGDIGRVYLGANKLKNMIKGRRTPKEKGNVSISSLFTRFVSEGRLDRAQKIIRTQPEFASAEVIAWDNGKWHQLNRYKGGSHGGRTRDKARQKIVTDVPKLDDYLKKKKDMVGFTKAGWANAAMKATGRLPAQMNKWITKHSASPASGRFSMKNASVARGEITNLVTWVSRKIDDAQAMRAFDESFMKDINARIKYLLDKEQRRK